jgi:MoxR-like ATPase
VVHNRLFSRVRSKRYWMIRYNVSFDDIRTVMKSALRHRIILNFEGEAEGITTDAVVDNILETVPTVEKTAAV